MTQAKSSPKNCRKCQGNSYLLSNRAGRVHADFCECFNCEKCGGDGRVFVEKENGISYLNDCECMVLKKRLKTLNGAGIPGKFADKSLETYQTMFDKTQKTAKARAQDFVKDFTNPGSESPRGLVFMGPPGLGKTHLASAILKKLILEEGVDGKFVDFFQLLSDIRHAYSEDRSEQSVINPYIRARLLVIDELAKGRNNEWELTVLDQFISNRYNAADKWTLFTTNFLNPSARANSKADPGDLMDTNAKFLSDSYKSETLPDRIGERIYSRMEEMSQFIHMEGKDYRHHVKPAHQKRKPRN